MADFSSFTHKWRAIPTTSSHSDANKVTKRSRQPVSCQPCRARKLKCDRQHPCDACTKRHEQDVCVYGRSTLPADSNKLHARKDDSKSSYLKAQERLKQLEELVRDMVDTPEPRRSPPSAISTGMTVSVQPQEGIFSMAAGNVSTYAGSTHWSIVLQHIHELKHDIGTESAHYEEDAVDLSQPDILFGGQRPPSLEHVLKNYLPQRTQVDRRISQYFNARYMILPLIHSKQFARQYEKFWADPLRANVVWVSIMFSICCLAASLSLASNRSPGEKARDMHPRDAFETAAGQCLLLGNYSKPQPFVVEAIALFLQSKYARSLDPSKEVALLFGIQLRLAYLMGYHRDGANFPLQYSPFETEMRRRVWAMLKQFDQMVAFQLGIPNNVPPDTWDTRHPRNLLDTDFDEDTKVLPSPRPETECTQILYFVVKSRIVDAYARVCHHAISFPSKPHTRDGVMELDKQIREAAATIPRSLEIRPVSQSITDPSYEIMGRLNISFLWRKSLCVLHRRYIASVDDDYSYNTCIGAASSMCSSIIDLYPEFQPGGTFENDSWMLSSFTIVDFLLATVILSLAMSVGRRKFVSSGGDPRRWLELDEPIRILGILDKSHEICVDLATRSREAQRVAGVLSAVLKRLRTVQQESAPTTDGARHFFDMTSGSLPEHAWTRNSRLAIRDREDVSLNPLSLSEGPTSVTASTGMMPSSWYLQDKAYETLSDARMELPNEPVNPSAMPVETTAGTTPSAGFNSGSTSFMSNAAGPTQSEVNMILGPFSNATDGVNGTDSIDWTQFDQLAGFFGGDVNLGPFDPFAMNGFTEAQLPQDSTQLIGYESWESAPIYALGAGARARHPLIGKSQ